MKRLPTILGVTLILAFVYVASYVWARNYLSVEVDTVYLDSMNSRWERQSFGWPPSQDHFINDLFRPATFFEELVFEREVTFGLIKPLPSIRPIVP